jgi:hypothetical protein
MKALAAVGAVAALVVMSLVMFVASIRDRVPPQTPRPEPQSSETARPRTVFPESADRPARPDVRVEVRKSTELARQTVTAATLDSYLDSLEARARKQGRVTAFEVEPGITLIDQLTGDSERATRFALRMETLQKQLEPPPAPAPVPEGVAEELAAR